MYLRSKLETTTIKVPSNNMMRADFIWTEIEFTIGITVERA